MNALTFYDYLAILRRWKKVCLTTGVTLLILTGFVAASWSNYRAIAVIQVEQPEILPTATATPGSDSNNDGEMLADQRISEIEQSVLSTSSLIDIITKFNLYPSARAKVPIGLIADGMRKKIRLEPVDSTLSDSTTGAREPLSTFAFTLSFDYSNPVTAQQVTDELVSGFLDQDLKERRTEAEATSTLLDVQIADLEKSMTEQEKKIADYEKEHGNISPESLAFDQQTLQSITLDLQNLNSQIATIEGSLGSLRAQLATVDPYSRVIADGQILTTPRVELKALQAQYTTLTAQYGPDYPDVVKVQNQIAALKAQISGEKGGLASPEAAQIKAQIADARTNLSAAEKTYGPDHPDVIALRKKLHSLEEQLANATTAPDAVVSDADNPAYLQLVSELHASEDQYKSLIEQRKQVEAEQEKYRKAVLENPEAAQQMAALSRDYDNAQLRYRELKEKKMAADIDKQMQQSRTGARLVLIDPPEVPIDTHPMRILLALAALIISVGGSFVSVAAAQILSHSVLGIRHLESIVGVAPLVAIPHMLNEDDRKRGAGLRLPWKFKRL